MSIYQMYSIQTDYVDIRFVNTVQASSLVNDNFVLTNVTTTTVIPDAFQEIDLTRDFYSTSRQLRLYWNTELVPETQYSITISNLKSLNGSTIASDVIVFDTIGMAVIGEPTEPITKDPVDVEDYSLKDIGDILYPIYLPGGSSSTLQIMSIKPDMYTAAYLAPSYNEGRIEIFFNASLAANYVSTDFFKMQQKKVQSGITRWEDVDVLVTSSSADKLVVIYMPSDDVPPVYGEPDKNYWISSYKYRLRISAEVGIIGSLTADEIDAEEIDGGEA